MVKSKVSTKTVSDIVENPKSDKFAAQERKDLLKIIRSDVEFGELIQKSYIKQKELDLKHYHMRPPSELENLTKRDWQADRNLGLARAIADSYQATLFATCWNPESINFVAVGKLDIDNRNNQEKFTKWGMGKQEANAAPEVYDFIHNRIVVGSAFYKIYRKRWEEWVDKRIPIKNAKGDTYKYNIKTEKVKMVKGMIENIPDIDDILMPEYGKNIQELPFFIHILHLDGETVLDYIDRKVFSPNDVEEYKKKLRNHAFNEKVRVLGAEKLKSQGIDSSAKLDNDDIRRTPVDLYEWYGFHTKDGRKEKYRVIVDLTNEEFLSGKPLRVINRSGKVPFTGGALVKEPGQIRGTSLMQTIAPLINAFHNVFNQKSDFQYVENCPFGFHNPDEGYTEQVFKLEPGVSYPVGGRPNESVYFPNLSRSMAWAESDMRILFEILEKLTGAATFFQTTGKGVSGTATRDILIDKNSETRFGLSASGIIQDTSEAVGMWFELYQDYPPKGLAERIVGEDGEQLFPNLSIDSLRGDTSVQMTPDTVAGSKTYRKELQLWAVEASQGCMWLQPQVNPQGNWDLWADTYKEVLNLSDNEVERYMGERPKSKFDSAQLDNEWYKFMKGEDFDPPEGETNIALQHLEGHMKQKEEKYHLLDEEYRPNFDAHLFKTMVNAMKFLKNAKIEQASNELAANTMANSPQGQGQPQGMQGQPAQQGQPTGQPQGIPGTPGGQPKPTVPNLQGTQ